MELHEMRVGRLVRKITNEKTTTTTTTTTTTLIRRLFRPIKASEMQSTLQLSENWRPSELIARSKPDPAPPPPHPPHHPDSFSHHNLNVDPRSTYCTGEHRPTGEKPGGKPVRIMGIAYRKWKRDGAKCGDSFTQMPGLSHSSFRTGSTLMPIKPSNAGRTRSPGQVQSLIPTAGTGTIGAI